MIKQNNLNLFSLAWISAAFFLLLLAISFQINFFLSGAASVINFLIIAGEIFLPIYILEIYKKDLREFNLYAHRVENFFDIFFPPFKFTREKPDTKKIFSELKFFFIFSAIVFSIYICGYLFFNFSLAKIFGQKIIFNLNFPPRIFLESIMQIFVVALPEEIFYRGFLQSILLKRWPNKKFIFNFPIGRAIIITNLIFALGHFVGGFFPARLLTFFPGLLFSYLVYKNKSLLSAILFHAFCNILGQILYASVFMS